MAKIVNNYLEKWNLTNNTDNTLVIAIKSKKMPGIRPKATINLLRFATKDEISQSSAIRTLLNNEYATLEKIEGDNSVDSIISVEKDELRGIDVTGDSVSVNKDLIINGDLFLGDDNAVWDDLRFPLVGNRIDVGAGRLDYNYFNGAVAFQGEGTPARYPQEPVSMFAQFPHEWKAGTIIKPHMHWYQQGATEPNWLLAYKIIRNGESITLETDFNNHVLLTKDTNAFTYTSGTITQITSFGEVDTSSMGISDSIHFVLFRDFNNTSTLFSGTDGGLNPELVIEFDVHYQIDAMGSRQEFIK